MKLKKIEFSEFIKQLDFYMHQGYSYTLCMRKMNLVPYFKYYAFTEEQNNKIINLREFYNKARKSHGLDKELPKYIPKF